ASADTYSSSPPQQGHPAAVHWTFLHLPDGCPGFSHEQQFTLNTLLWHAWHAVAGLKHAPLQVTAPGPHSQEQEVTLGTSLAPHCGVMHWPLLRHVFVGHSQAQVVALRVCPLAQRATQLPLHSSVPDGHSQAQVVALRTCPPVQVATQVPLHSSWPLGH